MKNLEQQAVKMSKDDSINFDEFYTFCSDNSIGDNMWDEINSEEIILQYIREMAEKGVIVSHILKAIESNHSMTEIYNIDLGNSMNTPQPIETKKELLEILTS
tara:strand:+ start:215 stop:523 length:309 start_codon:yes stop_codon:yes gene_type:complete